jgi:hypothetical protein
VLEDMPVQETADGIEELRKDDLPVGGVVVNLVHGRELADEDRDVVLAGRAPRDQVEAALAEAGIEPSAAVVDGLLAEGREHAERRALEDEQRRRIEKLAVPTYELPRLPDGIDLGGLYELAADLIDQGMA